MTARDRLNAALARMLEGGLPRCAEYAPDSPWVSDDPADRQWAARLCGACPLLEPCRDVGSEEKHTHGIWGGVDRSRTQRKAGRPSKGAES